MRRPFVALLGAAVLAAAAAGPAGAGTAAEPEITDAAGDANGITPQRYIFVWPFGDYGEGPDTRPASVDGADLRAIWFETAYTTSKTVDPSSGEIREVSYTPTGLRVNIKTEGPIASPGPTLWYEVWGALPTYCDGRQDSVSFSLKLPGSASDPDAGPARAEMAFRDGCGSTARLVSGFDLAIDGRVATLTYPFTARHLADVIHEGQWIERPGSLVGLRPTTILTAWPEIDRTGLGQDFEIGSDVPADVDCTADPDHLECEE